MDPEDLREYSSMSEFFLRRLKPGLRPIADYQLISPADGRVVNFGYIENRRVEQIKGVSYSLDALLEGTGPKSDSSNSSSPNQPPSNPSPISGNPGTSTSDNAVVNEEEFANLNGLSYTIDQLMGDEPHANQNEVEESPSPATTKRSTWSRLFGRKSSTASAATDRSIQSRNEPIHDASLPASTPARTDETDPAESATKDHSMSEQISLATQTFDSTSPHWARRGVPKEGNKMFFCVVYLAPGDYHRFHSPTNWVVEKRRHFAGELFSVSPYMTKLLKDLFVLNERVALLGRWRHGFFSMGGSALSFLVVGRGHVC